MNFAKYVKMAFMYSSYDFTILNDFLYEKFP